MNTADLLDFLRSAYPAGRWPKPLHLLQGRLLVEAGQQPAAAAREAGTSAKALKAILGEPEPGFAVLGVTPSDLTAADIKRARSRIAQVLIGRAAEMAFEAIYKEELGADAEFKLQDQREDRNDTDYRVLNGKGRRLYRINIKFFGSTFRRGPEMVGLEPEDCFPLATYKIHGALLKQDEEHLPYMFIVVTVPSLTAASIEPMIADRDAEILGFIHKSENISGKKGIEDRVIDQIVVARSPAFVTLYDKIKEAEWYVISARKADKLLKEMLFKRVFALRIPGFTRQFGRAELDMHFSLKEDLIGLRDFLDKLRDEGLTKMASYLERGTI